MATDAAAGLERGDVLSETIAPAAAAAGGGARAVCDVVDCCP